LEFFQRIHADRGLPLLVDASARGGEPLRDRELEAAALDPENRLRTSFSVGGRANHDAAIMILQRSGDDLRGARAHAVHEHGDDEIRPRLRLTVAVLTRDLWSSTPHADDLLPRIEKQLRDRDSLVQQ